LPLALGLPPPNSALLDSHHAGLSASESRDLSIRQAGPGDIPEIVRPRCWIYEDMNYIDQATLDAMSALSSAYLQKALEDSRFRARVECDSERAVAGGSVDHYCLAPLRP
jgi:hypothetical protein